MDGGGWASYWNSLLLATLTAFFGTLIIFAGAYLVEKSRWFSQPRSVLQFLAIVPLSVLGMVHWLAYIFFFNPTTFTIPFTSIELTNPLSFLYQTIWILVICSIVHYYIVPHLTALTALKQVDAEFEAVSASLKVPFYRTFSRVTFPICLPAILDIAPAAAMAMMIVYTSAGVRILHGLLTRGVARRTQAWRKR